MGPKRDDVDYADYFGGSSYLLSAVWRMRDWCAAVSYTHLDVYKRQVQEGRVYDLDSNLFNMSANFSYEEALKALQPMLYGEE